MYLYISTYTFFSLSGSSWSGSHRLVLGLHQALLLPVAASGPPGLREARAGAQHQQQVLDADLPTRKGNVPGHIQGGSFGVQRKTDGEVFFLGGGFEEKRMGKPQAGGGVLFGIQRKNPRGEPPVGWVQGVDGGIRC